MARPLLVIAVGRLGQGPEAQLCRQYAQRIVPAPELVEIDDRGRAGGATAVAWQADQILGKLTPTTYVWALDECGPPLASADFAQQIGAMRDQGRPLAFVIGGADGLDQRVRQRANKLLAFGRATWPHKLVRAMLLEQLYRANMILAGHPYHRA